MADEMLFIGGRLDSLSVAAGAPVENSNASYRDATYVDASVVVAGPDNIVEALFKNMSGGVLTNADVVSGETLFLHFCFYYIGTATSGNLNVVTLRDSSNFEWFAIRNRNFNAGEYGFFYNSGTGASPVWTQIGSNQVWVTGGTRPILTYDIKLTIGSPHVIEISIDGSLVVSTTFTQAGLTSLRKARFSFAQAGTQSYAINQVMASRNISTVGGKVKYSRATGAGTNSGWTGSQTDVNEAVNSDSTVNLAGSAGLKQSYPTGDVTIPTGFAIKEVRNMFRAKNDGGVPANIKSLVRSGGTDYSSSNVSGLTTAFTPVGIAYANNPNTGSPWTEANFNSAEFGFESAT